MSKYADSLEKQYGNLERVRKLKLEMERTNKKESERIQNMLSRFNMKGGNNKWNQRNFWNEDTYVKFLDNELRLE